MHDADQPRMIVPVENLVQFKKGLEEEADKVRTWVFNHAERLRNIPPPGSDPCSIDTMHLMSMKGQQAVDAALAYADRLSTAAQKLHDTAVAYGLVEENNANEFRQGPV